MTSCCLSKTAEVLFLTLHVLFCGRTGRDGLVVFMDLISWDKKKWSAGSHNHIVIKVSESHREDLKTRLAGNLLDIKAPSSIELLLQSPQSGRNAALPCIGPFFAVIRLTNTGGAGRLSCLHVEFTALHSQCILHNGVAGRAGHQVNLNSSAHVHGRAHPREWYLVKTLWVLRASVGETALGRQVLD